jgi:glycosyltransferase involved in cell wall biosynthesis
MIKVIFEGSIFLHQKKGGISKYIEKINDRFINYNINSVIYSPIIVSDNLTRNKKNIIYFFRFSKIPKFFTKIFYALNNLLTISYIKKLKPNILHFTYYNNFLIPYIKMPYILTVYDLIHERMRDKNKKFNKSKLIKKAEHIICISKQTKNDLVKFYKVKREKITIIYPGVDSRIKFIKKRKENYILFVGSRGRYKNFINFIKAYSRSKYLIKNFKVVCFGVEKFSYNEIELFNKLKITDRIIYKTGNDLKLENYYKKASLFVTTSLFEGFGLTPLEAMRCGCPVISSNIPIFKETLGNSCVYVDAKDVKDIKKNIERILKLKNLQKRLIERGYKRIKKFSWDKCTSETAKIYRQITSK